MRSRGVVAGVCLVALGGTWCAAVAARALRSVPGVPLDAAWAALAARSRTPGTVGVSEVLAALGTAPWSIGIATALALVTWRRTGLRSAVVLGMAALVSEAMVHLMKVVDLRPGPSGHLFEGVGSFPSGHTAFVATLAVSGAVLLPRGAAVRLALGGGVVLMALSRTVIAAHWLTDTIAGAVCGAATAGLVWVVAGPRASDARDGSERSAQRPPPDG